jgi:hypothetical protein
MYKILVVGDSFASYHQDSWTAKLGQEYQVDNFAINGASEYRILNVIQSSQLKEYDAVIVTHTSPNRIYIEKNPYYQISLSHPQCDLIYEDMRSRLPDHFAKQVVWWFENVFDLEQAKQIHCLLIEKIKTILKHKPCIHVSFFDLDCIPEMINLHHIWKSHPGSVNHLDQIGNRMVAETMQTQLKLLYNKEKL